MKMVLRKMFLSSKVNFDVGIDQMYTKGWTFLDPAVYCHHEIGLPTSNKYHRHLLDNENFINKFNYPYRKIVQFNQD